MPSPQVTVSDNGGAPIDPVASGTGVNVTAGHTIVVQLQSLAADVWACPLVGQDDQVAVPTFTLDPVAKHVTFTAPTAPFALIFESVVNNGQDVNGNAVATYRQRFGIYAIGTTGQRVVAANEENEGSTLFGWTTVINGLVQRAGSMVSVVAYATLANPVDPTGTLDSSAAFQAAVNALAGTGVALFVPAGTYKFSNRVNLPSNIRIIGSRGAKLVNAQTFTGSQVNDIFFAQPTANGNTGTLNAAVTVGSTSVTVNMTTKPVVGNSLHIGNANELSALIYDIISVSGVSNPYTVTLDRPVTIPWLSGASSVVREQTAYPHDIVIEGNGMVMTGTGDRYVELLGCLRGRIQDVNCDASGGTLGDSMMSFDIAGRDCQFLRCSGDGTGGTSLLEGFLLESNEHSSIIDCQMTNSPATGLYMADCVDSAIVRSGHRATTGATYGSGGGIIIGSDVAIGNIGCSVVDCFTHGGQYGLVLNGGTNQKITRSRFEYANVDGVLFNATGIAQTTFEDCSVKGSATGFVGGSSNTDTKIRGMDFSACPTACLTTASDLDAMDIVAKSLSATMTAFAFTGGTVHRLSRIDYAHSGISNVFSQQSSSRIEVDGALVSLGASSIAFYGPSGSGTFILRNCKTAGSASNTSGVDLTSTTAVIDPTCDFSSTATPLGVHAGGVVIAPQWAGPPAIQNATGALTLLQLQKQNVESSGNASGTVTITASVNIPGQEWTFRNNNTSTSTTTFMGITVAITKTAVIRINSAGTGERVTADT